MTFLELAMSHQGKEYQEGWQDCYTAMKDIYYDYCGLELTDYARPHLWFMHPQFKFMDTLFEAEGFKDIGDNPRSIQVGDVLMMRIGRTECSNHLASYVGGNKIFHHLTDMRSLVVEYEPKWQSRVYRILRHPQVTKKIEKTTELRLTNLPYSVRAKLAGGPHA